MRSNDFTWSEVGQRMQRLRLARGFNQADLAAAAGLTKAAISIFEAGQTNPRIQHYSRSRLHSIAVFAF
jgi:transcriptional regulator with XRE-family HTH domain